MTRPRAADDFETIRARMEELRRERERTEAGQIETCGQTRRRAAKAYTGRRRTLGRSRTGIADPARYAGS